MVFHIENGRRGASHKRDGFTLIELLVVMAIIATLLTIAVPRYFQSLERAKEATLRQDLSIMREALDKYLGDRGQYPQTLQDLVERRYIRALPLDPFTKSGDTWVLVQNDSPDLTGIRDVQSGATGVSSAGVPFGEF
jgi:general secretion pathway protein G